jgi:hypothetical protein
MLVLRQRKGYAKFGSGVYLNALHKVVHFQSVELTCTSDNYLYFPINIDLFSKEFLTIDIV